MGQLKNTLVAFAGLVVLIFVVFLGVNKTNNGDKRIPSAYGSGDDNLPPQGHSYTEKEELWHLSEGADVMPLRWFLNIESVFDTKANPKIFPGTYLYESLGEKYGVVETNKIEGTYSGSTDWSSPMKWVGMTLAWSEPISELPDLNGEFRAVKDINISEEKPKSDVEAYRALSAIDQQGSREVSNSKYGGQIEIPMMGTNCAFCHSNITTFKKGKYGHATVDAFVEGAPNLLHVRGFFKDMTGGTLKTMLDEAAFMRYLMRLDKKGLLSVDDAAKLVPTADRTWLGKWLDGDPPEDFNDKEKTAFKAALNFVNSFKSDLEGVPNLGDGSFDGFIGVIVSKYRASISKKVGSVKQGVIVRATGFPVNRPVIAEYMGRFLAMSYGLSYEEQVLKTPALKARMKWIAKLLSPDPDLASTPEGYARTDAFGRISNSVARLDNELPLIGPASFPPMWGMKFSNLFHFNGNTNSVIMRNIGQSFGLGALVFTEDDGLPPDKKGRPLVSSNLYNLNRIEKHLYNIKYPEWNTLAPDELKVDTNRQEDFDQVQRGCNVYLNNCKECHDRDVKVGPKQTLVKHFVYSLKKTGTDPNHNMIQPTPVQTADGVRIPFRRALFELTKKVKERYIEEMGMNDSQMAKWENRTHRGKEHFRDTFLGENFQDDWLLDVFGIETPTNYYDDYELKYMALVNRETEKPLAKKYGYIAKSLAGIWATAPYLHNGSVPTVEHLINPRLPRPDQFYIGCRVYDHEKLGYIWDPTQYREYGCTAGEFQLFDTGVKIKRPVINGNGYVVRGYQHKFNEKGEYLGGYTNGNYNGGHDGPGQILKNVHDVKALMTFLKVLRPTDEYAWDSPEPYEFSADGKSCVAKKVPLPDKGNY